MAQSSATELGGKRGTRSPPALDPERMSIVQPWRDFISKGLIEKLTCSFTPGGMNIDTVKVSQRVKLPEGFSHDECPIGIAKQAIRDSGLSGQKTQKPSKDSEPPPPLRSLTGNDVNLDGAKFEARLKSVADKIGASAAAGRIGSLKLYIEGADTFDKWWSAAPRESKLRLLCDERHLKAMTSDQRSTLLAAVPASSPFRGPVPTPSEEEEEAASQDSQREAPPKEKSSKKKSKGGK